MTSTFALEFLRLRECRLSSPFTKLRAISSAAIPPTPLPSSSEKLAAE